MPTPYLFWQATDSHLMVPALRNVIDATALLAFQQGLITSSLGEPDVAVRNGAMFVRPWWDESANLLTASLALYSEGATEAWGVAGLPGTWILLATDGLASSELASRYWATSAYLQAGESFMVDSWMFAPSTPDLFEWWLGWAGTMALGLRGTGEVTLWENTADGYVPRAGGKLFDPPLFGRQLRLAVQPLRRQVVYLSSSDGHVIEWWNENPVAAPTGSTPELAYYAYGGGSLSLAVGEVAIWSRWMPIYYRASNDGSEALVKGPLVDLGREYSGGLRVDYDSERPVGTALYSWLEDISGAVTDAGRYVRAAMLLQASTNGLLTPMIYNMALAADPEPSTDDLISLDLSDLWESIAWERSRDDLNANVTVQLVPDAGVESLSAQLQRYIGFDLDGTPQIRAYLTPQTDTAGPYDRLVLKGRGRLLRLENSLFDGQETFAGLTHTQAMRQLLAGEGLIEGTDFTIAEDVSPAVPKMADRDGGDSDPTTPDAGTTRREYAEYICKKLSGWYLLEQPDGALYYAPLLGTYQGEWLEYGVDLVPTPPTRWVLADSWRESVDPSNFRNEIYVLGEAPDGTPLLGMWINEASQKDPTATDYVGQRRLLIYVDASLNTEEMVEAALNLIVADAGVVKRRAAFSSEYDQSVQVGDTLTARGRTWLIDTVRPKITGPECLGFVDYEVEEHAA